MQTFDHLAISAATLADGAAHVEAQTGHAMGPGGTHALMATHNRLSGLGAGEYLEVIAIDPDATPPDRPRWFDLDRRAEPPRLSNWVMRCDDIDAALARYPGGGRPISLSRGDFRWRMAVPDDGILPFDGCAPALIQWDSPAPSFPESGLSLLALTLSHPEADALRDLLASLTDDPRIAVEAGAPHLAATLDTPTGRRTLS